MAGQGGQTKVTGMEKIITNPGQSPVAHFVSGLDECEKKTVVWEVRNIVELLGMSMEQIMENGITFDAGHSIGIPANWCFHLYRSRGGLGCVGYFLELSSESKVDLAYAGCSISLSCGGEIISFGDVVPKEFNRNIGLKDGAGWGYFGAPTYIKGSDIIQKTDNGQKALEVTLTLKVFSSKDSSVTAKEDVISDFGKLLESGDGTDSADVEISVPSVVGGEVDASSYKRKVHKCILMARSSVFSKMFAKESEMIEAKTGKVLIKDLSPKGLGIILHYIYTGKVLDEWVKVPVEILNSAEKYDLGRLKQYCGRNLISAVTPSNAWEMFQLAKLHKLSFAKSAIAEFVSRNARAVLEAGEEEPSDGNEKDADAPE